MARRRFFAFAVGTAALAACVGVLEEKGGVRISVDRKPRALGGETASQALDRLRAGLGAEHADRGEN